MMKKKKAPLSPEAAKILEQYRTAGQARPGEKSEGGAAPSDSTAKHPTTPPTGSASMRRSGTRGK